VCEQHQGTVHVLHRDTTTSVCKLPFAWCYAGRGAIVNSNVTTYYMVYIGIPAICFVLQIGVVYANQVYKNEGSYCVQVNNVA
jgi:hypothetical protein